MIHAFIYFKPLVYLTNTYVVLPLCQALFQGPSKYLLNLQNDSIKYLKLLPLLCM